MLVIDKVLKKFEGTKAANTLLNHPENITPETVRQGVGSVGFAMTKQCNIRCDRCYVQEPRPGILTREQIVGALDEAPHAGIALGGGDPFMCVEETVKALKLITQEKNRPCTVVTNGLLLGSPVVREKFLRLMGNDSDLWQRLSFGMSIDSMHQAGSRLAPQQYSEVIAATARLLNSLGSRVTTNSVILHPEQDLALINSLIRPLIDEGVIAGMAASPNMFDPYNADSLEVIEGLMAQTRLLAPSPRHIEMLRGGEGSVKKTAPWTIVEVDPDGVVGPSPYYHQQQHFGSMLDMYQAYDWKLISENHPAETTVTQAANSWMRVGQMVLPDPGYYMQAALATIAG